MLLLANYEGRSGVPKAVEMLKAKSSGLRAIVEGIKLVEADPEIHTVGLASRPNLLGELELDAAVMDGDTRRSGAVGALRGYKHPVEVAYEVMRRLDHEILVGKGAERFAREIGAESSVNETDYSAESWRSRLKDILTEEQRKRFPEINLLEVASVGRDPGSLFDTTVYLCIDHAGRICSAASTAGWPWKYPGRLGDSPIIGAGSYTDSRYGACACTGAGEMTIRAGTARAVVLYLELGYSLRDAVQKAAEDLSGLKTGFCEVVAIHAINSKGEHRVLTVNAEQPTKYLVWNDGMSAPVVREAKAFQAD